MNGLVERIRWNCWPGLDSPKGIARALFYGVVANLVLAALAGIFVIATPKVLEQVGWPLLATGGAIHLILAWFTYRGSRIATVLAVALLLGCIAYAAVTGQLVHPRDDVKEAFFPFIGLLLLVNGVRGAFALHRRSEATTTIA
jgi:hypothetical protein